MKNIVNVTGNHLVTSGLSEHDIKIVLKKYSESYPDSNISLRTADYYIFARFRSNSNNVKSEIIVTYPAYFKENYLVLVLPVKKIYIKALGKFLHYVDDVRFEDEQVLTTSTSTLELKNKILSKYAQSINTYSEEMLNNYYMKYSYLLDTDIYRTKSIVITASDLGKHLHDKQ